MAAGLGVLQTSSWVMFIVLMVFLVVSLAVEKGIDVLEEWLAKRNRKGLLAAVGRIKTELMLVGLVSMIIIIFNRNITSICVTPSDSWWMLSRASGCPCCLKDTRTIDVCWFLDKQCGQFVEKGYYDSVDFCNCEDKDPQCLVKPDYGAKDGTKSYYDGSYEYEPMSPLSAPEIALGSAATKPYSKGPVCKGPYPEYTGKCKKGEVEAMSLRALEEVHVLLFLTGTVHVACCLIVLILVKVKAWVWHQLDNVEEEYVKRALAMVLAEAKNNFPGSTPAATAVAPEAAPGAAADTVRMPFLSENNSSAVPDGVQMPIRGCYSAQHVPSVSEGQTHMRGCFSAEHVPTVPEASSLEIRTYEDIGVKGIEQGNVRHDGNGNDRSAGQVSAFELQQEPDGGRVAGVDLEMASYPSMGEEHSVARKWFMAWLSQFGWSAVGKRRFYLLRACFIYSNHLTAKFHFSDYVEASFEDDFSEIVGFSSVTWMYIALVVLLMGPAGWIASWVNLACIACVVAINTQLVYVVRKTVESGTIHKLSNAAFLFGKPTLLLPMVHILLSTLSFSFTSQLWFLWVNGEHSCYFEDTSMRAMTPWPCWVDSVLALLTLWLLGSTTMPLYFLAVHMQKNPRLKHIMTEEHQQFARKWLKTARKNIQEKQRIVAETAGRAVESLKTALSREPAGDRVGWSELKG